MAVVALGHGLGLAGIRLIAHHPQVRPPLDGGGHHGLGAGEGLFVLCHGGGIGAGNLAGVLVIGFRAWNGTVIGDEVGIAAARPLAFQIQRGHAAIPIPAVAVYVRIRHPVVRNIAIFFASQTLNLATFRLAERVIDP